MKNLLAKLFTFLFFVLIAQGISVQKRIHLVLDDRADQMWSTVETKYEVRTDYKDFLATESVNGNNDLIASGLGGTGGKLVAENAGRST